MAERRYAVALATPTLTRGDENPPTPCLDQWEPFEVLMTSKSGPDLRWALNEAKSLCGRCDVAVKCHTDNADERWAQVMAARPDTIPCVQCGNAMEVRPCSGGRRMYCDDGCYQAAKRVRLRDRPVVTDEDRAAHAAYQRAKVAGEPITDELREGERTYMAHARRSKKEQDAA